MTKNTMTRNPYKNRQSARYKFVYPGKQLKSGKAGKFQVRIRTPLKPGQSRRDQYYIGSYHTEEEGARAADKFLIDWMIDNPDHVLEMHKYLNFPLDAPPFVPDLTEIMEFSDLISDMYNEFPIDDSYVELIQFIESGGSSSDIDLECHETLDTLSPIVAIDSPVDTMLEHLTSADHCIVDDIINGDIELLDALEC
jgi:hypothetical protein